MKQWKRKVNLVNFGAARLAALVASAFGNSNISIDDFLPFPAPLAFVSIEEANIIIEKLAAEDSAEAEVVRG